MTLGYLPNKKVMIMLENEVLSTIKKYNMIKDGDKVVIGVSGGPDSITLLNVLNKFKEKLNIKIYVAHINHSIRKEADEETEYVREFCKKIDVEFFFKKIDVESEAKKLKIGTEEAGRNIRYAFFEEVAEKVGANKIATAHNSNDNAETVLMNIIRGTSISGLKGIEKMRDNKFIRPLIETTRATIEEYCRIEKLSPRYDKSNKENIYTRNKIRNLLIPYIQKEFNPNIIEGINRLSNIAEEEECFINSMVEEEYKRIVIVEKNNNTKPNNTNYIVQKSKKQNANNIIEKIEKDVITTNIAKTEEEEIRAILNLKEFNELDNVIKSRLILYTISKLYGGAVGIEKIHIDDIIKLCENNIGNKYLTPRKGIKIYVKKGKIFFLSNSSFRRQ